jgi:hypothetical protein
MRMAPERNQETQDKVGIKEFTFSLNENRTSWQANIPPIELVSTFLFKHSDLHRSKFYFAFQKDGPSNK